MTVELSWTSKTTQPFNCIDDCEANGKLKKPMQFKAEAIQPTLAIFDI